MDRKAVAQTLGCSEKTVSRYVAAGRLPDIRKGGALDVPEADVERLRIELETPVETKRQGGTGQAETAIVILPKRPIPNPSNTLAVFDDASGRDRTRRETGWGRPFVPTAEKLLLSLDEASALTGLSPNRLRAAIGERTLVARKVGRGWKMRRGDVVNFVDSMFEGKK